MFKVENFLCCLRLEIGGYVYASLFLANAVLGFVLFTCICFSATPCEDWTSLYENYIKGSAQDTPAVYVPDAAFCSGESGMRIAMKLVLLLILCIALTISSLCVAGVYKRNHNLLKPFMFAFALQTIWIFISFFLGRHWLIWLPETIIFVYGLLVLYSLHERFKEERNTASEVQNMTSAERRALSSD